MRVAGGAAVRALTRCPRSALKEQREAAERRLAESRRAMRETAAMEAEDRRAQRLLDVEPDVMVRRCPACGRARAREKGCVVPYPAGGARAGHCALSARTRVHVRRRRTLSRAAKAHCVQRGALQPQLTATAAPPRSWSHAARGAGRPEAARASRAASGRGARGAGGRTGGAAGCIVRTSHTDARCRFCVGGVQRALQERRRAERERTGLLAADRHVRIARAA
jgi:hypothetical protein